MAIYIVLINILGLMVMGYDKLRARAGAWRVPERYLMILALAGGAAGIFTGIWIFRHKTRHLKFTVLVPAILALQIVLWLMLIKDVVDL